jgi:hypothetical protein
MFVATAVIARPDLARLLESATPLRVNIDEARGRALSIGRADLELVPGKGLRLHGDAVLSWDFARVPITVKIKSWQLLLVPRVGVRDGAHVLTFDPELERIDVQHVPGFLDDKVASGIRGLVAQHGRRLAWNFARTLSAHVPLPTRFSPALGFELFPEGGEVSVNDRELRLVVPFGARFVLEGQLEEREEREERESAAQREEVAPPQARPRPQPSSHLGLAPQPPAVERRRLPHPRIRPPARRGRI